MTLKEAMKLLGIVKEGMVVGTTLSEKEAVLLGIEALKEIKCARERGYISAILKLPGETNKQSGFTEEELKDLRHIACDDTIG